MKRFMMIAVLAAALAALLAGTALAGPANPPGSGLGYRMQSQNVAPGTCGACGGAGAADGMMGRGAPSWAGQPDEVAKLLDMTADRIQAERQAGKSLAEIAASKDVTVDELVDTILTAKKANLAQLVADGKLSQAQADFMIERMETQVRVMVERTSTGPMRGRGQGMRGGERGFNGFNR